PRPCDFLQSEAPPSFRRRSAQRKSRRPEASRAASLFGRKILTERARENGGPLLRRPPATSPIAANCLPAVGPSWDHAKRRRAYGRVALAIMGRRRPFCGAPFRFLFSA
ncbi:unnamed protein product, partial [Amoebophrya sp. A120]